MSHKLNDLQRLEIELKEVDVLIDMCNAALQEHEESEHSLELLKIDLIELHKRKALVLSEINNHCGCLTKCNICKCKEKIH